MIRRYLFIAATVIALAGCSGSGGDPDSPSGQPDSQNEQPDSTDEQPDSTDEEPDSTEEQPDSPGSEQPDFPPEQGAALPDAFSGELRVFPGAEGFGTQTTAGRGGELCFVTNTNDSGSGSLRDCLEASGRRIVVFKTGGTITLNSRIVIKNPFVSIYGQTAPGDGILVRSSLDSADMVFRITTHDVLMQHLRVRPGSSRVTSCCRDALSVGTSDAGNVYNIVIDHNSFTWGVDEGIGIWYDSHDMTFSNNLIGAGLHDNGSNDSGPAGRGFLVGANGAHSISVHHNMIVNSYQRNPLIKTTGIVDVTSNLIYHHVTRGGQHSDKYQGQKVNWVNNLYVPLLSNTNSATWVRRGDIALIDSNSETRAYFQGNLGHNRNSDDKPEWALAFTDNDEPYNPSLNYHSDTRFPAPPITETAAQDLESTLPDIVGATIPIRSPVDQRLIDQFRERRGDLINCVEQADRPNDARCATNAGGWPTLDPGSAPIDSDNDAIPDDWELANAMNPNESDSHLDSNNDGYTNLEDWIFSLR